MRKKKPEPGALAEEDMERVEVPPEPMIQAPPPTENGDMAGEMPEPAPDATTSTLAPPVKEEEGEEEGGKEEKKKVPSPRVKSSTPKRPKPSK